MVAHIVSRRSHLVSALSEVANYGTEGRLQLQAWYPTQTLSHGMFLQDSHVRHVSGQKILTLVSDCSSLRVSLASCFKGPSMRWKPIHTV
jgi:hypothetical protein